MIQFSREEGREKTKYFCADTLSKKFTFKDLILLMYRTRRIGSIGIEISIINGDPLTIVLYEF